MFDAGQPERDGWVLKGGYALELRFRQARATKDLDLTVRVAAVQRDGGQISVTSLRERLLTATAVRLPDFFTFAVGEAMLTLDQAPEGGARFPVDARIDGRTFVKFHVDLGAGDEVLDPLDEIVGEDWLGFAGITPIAVPALSAEQHWAEKLHAYTRPRDGRTNTRVKDLIDLVLLIERETLGGRSRPGVGGGDICPPTHTRGPARASRAAHRMGDAFRRTRRGMSTGAHAHHSPCSGEPILARPAQLKPEEASGGRR